MREVLQRPLPLLASHCSACAPRNPPSPAAPLPHLERLIQSLRQRRREPGVLCDAGHRDALLLVKLQQLGAGRHAEGGTWVHLPPPSPFSEPTAPSGYPPTPFVSLPGRPLHWVLHLSSYHRLARLPTKCTSRHPAHLFQQVLALGRQLLHHPRHPRRLAPPPAADAHLLHPHLRRTATRHTRRYAGKHAARRLQAA